MKEKVQSLILGLVLSTVPLTTFAQSNTVALPITLPGGINIFTNFPSTTPDLSTLGISAGAITLSGQAEAYAKADWNFGGATNFWSRFNVSADIYSAPGGSTIDAAAGYIGYRIMCAKDYELTLHGFGRRYWNNFGGSEPKWTAGGGIEANWRVIQGNNLFYDTELDFVSRRQELKVGLKFYF